MKHMKILILKLMRTIYIILIIWVLMKINKIWNDVNFRLKVNSKIHTHVFRIGSGPKQSYSLECDWKRIFHLPRVTWREEHWSKIKEIESKNWNWLSQVKRLKLIRSIQRLELIRLGQEMGLTDSSNNYVCDWTWSIVTLNHMFNHNRWHNKQYTQLCLGFLFGS